MARNILHFTTDDVRVCIGREPTDAEYRAIVNSLACNEMLSDIIIDTFHTFTLEQEALTKSQQIVASMNHQTDSIIFA